MRPIQRAPVDLCSTHDRPRHTRWSPRTQPRAARLLPGVRPLGDRAHRCAGPCGLRLAPTADHGALPSVWRAGTATGAPTNADVDELERLDGDTLKRTSPGLAGAPRSAEQMLNSLCVAGSSRDRGPRRFAVGAGEEPVAHRAPADRSGATRVRMAGRRPVRCFQSAGRCRMLAARE